MKNFLIKEIIGITTSNDVKDETIIKSFQNTRYAHMCAYLYNTLFFNKPGTNDRQAHIVNTPIEVQENASLELLIFCNVLPACIAITEGGATPQNVPNVNVYNGTPITGAAKLINQLGRIGVIRKNSI
uniref:Uncharacterized protein n=1 Tax=Glossina palpalis gambiensis TaxID=67801 RepID=A0A1B0AKV6_9MUSC